MSSGRKIPEYFENPVDNLLIDFANYIAPSFHALGMTPNMITGLSALFGIMSIYFLHKKSYIHAGVCFFIQYFFDCMDGFFARKYKMTSKLGDLFDHIKDAIVIVGIVYIFYQRKDWYGIALTLTTTLCVTFMLGCQEVLYDSKESPSLEVTKALSPCTTKESAHKYLPYLRWLGCGTWNLILALYIISKNHQIPMAL